MWTRYRLKIGHGSSVQRIHQLLNLTNIPWNTAHNTKNKVGERERDQLFRDTLLTTYSLGGCDAYHQLFFKQYRP